MKKCTMPRMFFNLNKKAIQENLSKVIFVSQTRLPKENFYNCYLQKRILKFLFPTRQNKGAHPCISLVPLPPKPPLYITDICLYIFSELLVSSYRVYKSLNFLYINTRLIHGFLGSIKPLFKELYITIDMFYF